MGIDLEELYRFVLSCTVDIVEIWNTVHSIPCNPTLALGVSKQRGRPDNTRDSMYCKVASGCHGHALRFQGWDRCMSDLQDLAKPLERNRNGKWASLEETLQRQGSQDERSRSPKNRTFGSIPAEITPANTGHVNVGFDGGSTCPQGNGLMPPLPSAGSMGCISGPPCGTCGTCPGYNSGVFGCCPGCGCGCSGCGCSGACGCCGTCGGCSCPMTGMGPVGMMQPGQMGMMMGNPMGLGPMGPAPMCNPMCRPMSNQMGSMPINPMAGVMPPMAMGMMPGAPMMASENIKPTVPEPEEEDSYPPGASANVNHPHYRPPDMEVVPGLTDRRFVGVIHLWFEDKGYGFIECPEITQKCGQDAFLHRTQRKGFKRGQTVSFAVYLNYRKKPQATELRRAEKP